MEDGAISYPERGSPQGGVISPLVSNLDLHEVLDRWFEQEVKPRLRGRAFMARFEVQRRWHQWLNRRSHATRLDWPAFNRLLIGTGGSPDAAHGIIRTASRRQQSLRH